MVERIPRTRAGAVLLLFPSFVAGLSSSSPAKNFLQKARETTASSRGSACWQGMFSKGSPCCRARIEPFCKRFLQRVIFAGASKRGDRKAYSQGQISSHGTLVNKETTNLQPWQAFDGGFPCIANRQFRFPKNVFSVENDVSQQENYRLGIIQNEVLPFLTRMNDVDRNLDRTKRMFRTQNNKNNPLLDRCFTIIIEKQPNSYSRNKKIAWKVQIISTDRGQAYTATVKIRVFEGMPSGDIVVEFSRRSGDAIVFARFCDVFIEEILEKCLMDLREESEQQQGEEGPQNGLGDEALLQFVGPSDPLSETLTTGMIVGDQALVEELLEELEQENRNGASQNQEEDDFSAVSLQCLLDAVLIPFPTNNQNERDDLVVAASSSPASQTQRKSRSSVRQEYLQRYVEEYGRLDHVMKTDYLRLEGWQNLAVFFESNPTLVARVLKMIIDQDPSRSSRRRDGARDSHPFAWDVVGVEEIGSSSTCTKDSEKVTAELFEDFLLQLVVEIQHFHETNPQSNNRLNIPPNKILNKSETERAIFVTQIWVLLLLLSSAQEHEHLSEAFYTKFVQEFLSYSSFHSKRELETCIFDNITLLDKKLTGMLENLREYSVENSFD